MIRFLYRLLGWSILVLGAMHILAATRIFTGVTAPALWFASGGLTMMLVGALNLLNDAYGASARGLRWVCVAGNVVMTAFASVAGVVTGASVGELVVVVGVMGGAAVLSMLRAHAPVATVTAVQSRSE